MYLGPHRRAGGVREDLRAARGIRTRPSLISAVPRVAMNGDKREAHRGRGRRPLGGRRPRRLRLPPALPTFPRGPLRRRRAAARADAGRLDATSRRATTRSSAGPCEARYGGGSRVTPGVSRHGESGRSPVRAKPPRDLKGYGARADTGHVDAAERREILEPVPRSQPPVRGGRGAAQLAPAWRGHPVHAARHRARWDRIRRRARSRCSSSSPTGS